MITKNSCLSSGLEDYIEAIYIAKLTQEQYKGAELARKLNVSRASVSEALSKLVDKGLISYNRYEYISLTPKGEQEAIRVYQKHHILNDFFVTVLGISPAEAGENACKIEHIVSENILSRMKKLTDYYRNNEKISDIYTEGK